MNMHMSSFHHALMHLNLGYPLQIMGKRDSGSYLKTMHYRMFISVPIRQSRTKFMKQGQEINQNWTGRENFDICLF